MSLENKSQKSYACLNVRGIYNLKKLKSEAKYK